MPMYGQVYGIVRDAATVPIELTVYAASATQIGLLMREADLWACTLLLDAERTRVLRTLLAQGLAYLPVGGTP